MIYRNSFKVLNLVIWEDRMIPEEEMILALAICEILGRPTKPDEIQEAFDTAHEKFYRPQQSPRPAKKTYAHRRTDQKE